MWKVCKPFSFQKFTELIGTIKYKRYGSQNITTSRADWEITIIFGRKIKCNFELYDRVLVIWFCLNLRIEELKKELEEYDK